MNLKSLIGDIYPDLKEKSNSEQYDLSEELIKKKINLNKTQKEMAQLLDIPLEQYLKMEDGSIDIDVKTYKKALVKL